MIEFCPFLNPWEKKIVDSYPLVYLEPNPNLRAWYNEEKFNKLIKEPNFCNLRYGFEFESGWKDIITEFSFTANSLVKYLRDSGIQKDASVHACIYKEKMALLALQGDTNLIEPFNTVFNSYIYSTERRSSVTCEISGTRGYRCRKGGNLKTLSHKEGRRWGYSPCDDSDKEHWGYLDNQDNNKNVC